MRTRDFSSRDGPIDGRDIMSPSGTLCDLLQAALMLLDQDGRIILWSAESERAFGYGAEEAVGRDAARLLAAPDPPETAVLLSTRARSGGAGVFPLRHRDGTTRDMDVRTARLVGADGVARVLGVAVPAETTRQVEWDMALWKSMVEQAAVGLAVFDTDLRWVMVNPTLEHINGMPMEDLVGRRIHEVLPTLNPDAIETRMRQVLETGEPLLDQEHVGRTAADPDRDHAWSESWYRLEAPDGRVLGLVVVVIDVTERHRAAREAARARERLAVVADAGARIGATLDPWQIGRELAEVAVPRLADLAIVEVLDSVLVPGKAPSAGDDGSAECRTLAVAAVEGLEAVRAANPVGEPTSHGAAHLVAQCVRQACPVLLPTVSGPMLRRVARDERALMALAGAGVHSCLLAPLIARSEVLGTVTFYRAANPCRFDGQDLTLAAELAGHTATCIDNARLYARERDAALTLQRSLLPRLSPMHPGVEIAARYLPAGSEVGGDWFDVLPLKDDRLGLIVGDVMGKGVHAAAIMGQLRTATRVLARLDLPPVELLHQLDIVAGTLEEWIATCLYAVCDPVRRRCEFVSAGHLPPVVVSPDGRADLVEIPAGAPLGVGGVPFRAQERELPDGAVLVMYTDGLVEDRRCAIDVGLRDLLRLLAGGARPLDQICDAVLGDLPRVPDDDIALLLARLSPERVSGAR